MRHSPHGSALYRALHPEWWVTPDLSLLRDVEFSLRVLVWHNTDDGHKGRNPPKPVLLTEAERNAAKPESEKYDRQPVADMLAWLGWKKPHNEAR